MALLRQGLRAAGVRQGRLLTFWTVTPGTTHSSTSGRGRNVMTKKSVLVIGLEPTLIDFSDPAYGAYPGMDAAKVLADLKADGEHLNTLGYDVHTCLTDFGETAETVVIEHLKQKRSIVSL
jgi:hypothetical protein